MSLFNLPAVLVLCALSLLMLNELLTKFVCSECVFVGMKSETTAFDEVGAMHLDFGVPDNARRSKVICC